MRVGTRLAGGFLALILLFGGPLVFYSWVVDRSVATAGELRDVDSRLLLGTTSQLELLEELRDNADKYRITSDDGYFDLYYDRRSALSDTLEVLRGLSVTGEPREAFENLYATWDGFREAYTHEADKRVEAKKLYGLSSAAWAEFSATVAELQSQTRRVRFASQVAMEAKLGDMSRRASRASTTGWVTLAVSLLLGGLLAILIVRSIARPLSRIERGTAALARGDFSSRVDVPGRSEFAELGKRFNEMAGKLAELDLAKRDFLARVSHDLKTPLASIQETQRVMLQGAPGELNEKQRRLTQLGLANAERLARMISRILELSRLEAGVEEYAFEPVDLIELCPRVIERFSPQGTPEVTFTGPSEPAFVTGDRAALQRVLDNLLENARSHAGGGRIDVKVSVTTGSDPRVVVGVRDHGPGIPEEHRDSIFRSFAQKGDVRIASGHVGLGLAICREIVTAHEGEIWVQGPEDGGSIFAFAIPVSKHARESDRRPAAPGVIPATPKPEPVATSVALVFALVASTGCASAGAGEPDLGLPEAQGPPTRIEPVEVVPEPAPTPHPFDVHFEGGDWAAAAAAFEDDITLHADERALFRAGLVYAMPGSGVFNRGRARARLDDLLALFPESSYRGIAEVVRGLVAELDRSAAARIALEQQLERLKAVDLKDPPPPF
ncbi:MAG: ATP-binding protein [Gemmatimonadetes bacterium]|nr:ATP-binding protein [Gemmatimonadota bacterium]